MSAWIDPEERRMKRRSRVGREPGKSRRPKMASTEARGGASLADRRVAPVATRETETSDLARERDEAVEQLSAVLDILKVISSSPGKPEPVFQAILEHATRICEARFGVLNLYDGDAFRRVAIHNTPPQFATRIGEIIYPHPASGLAHLARTNQVAHIDDLRTRRSYLEGEASTVALVDLAGARTLLMVPMLSESTLVGNIGIFRREVRPFSERQIELVKNFAAQAAMAIENARLFNELRQSLEQQTAASEVLDVISSSAGELEPVFSKMLENATRACDASFGTLNLWDGTELDLVAHNVPREFMRLRKKTMRPHPDTPMATTIRTHKVGHFPDLKALPAYAAGVPNVVAVVDAAGGRTMVVVPMLKESELIGMFALFRQEVRPFTDRQIALVENFAKQAVIAIENARLFDEVQQRTRELSQSLENLRDAQDRLVQTEKLASLGQLTAGIAHEIKNPLNFVNNFSALSAELVDELDATLAPVTFEEKTRGDVSELTLMLKSNLEKVVQHGKRADSIVKNMLLHSREGSGERRSADVNTLVRESLNLAYHGARAEKAGFSITLNHHLDPEVGAIDLYPQEITRALLNLISNGFYAATRRKLEANDASFEPVLSATTRNLGKAVEIRIRDNGSGISSEVREKMFNPFFTTKPTGEGTGLGLSMTYDIIVKQHGGRIDVETEIGVFTEFIITLPCHNDTVVDQKPE
jgi:signal transduction histidine kinase